MSDIQEQSQQQLQAESESMPGAGSIVLGMICLVVALLAFGLGALERSRVNNYDANEIHCGDDLMSPGDTCIDWGGDGGGDYAEMREQHQANHETSQRIASISTIVARAAAGLGVVLLLLGVVRVMAARRRLATGT